MTGARLVGTTVGENRLAIPQPHSLGSLDRGAVSNPERFGWVKTNLETRAAVNTCPLDFGTNGAETEDSSERPVVSAFLAVVLGNFKATTKMA